MTWLYNNSNTTKLYQDGYARNNKIPTGANLSETIFKTQFNWNDSTFTKANSGGTVTLADGDTIRIGQISRNIIPAFFTVSVRTNDSTHRYRNISVGLAPPANDTEFNNDTGPIDDYSTASSWIKNYFGTILVQGATLSVQAPTEDITPNQLLAKGEDDFMVHPTLSGRPYRTISDTIRDADRNGFLPSWWRISNYYDIVVTMGDASDGGSAADVRKTLAFDAEFIMSDTF